MQKWLHPNTMRLASISSLHKWRL